MKPSQTNLNSREQAFAFYLAHGINCADSARRAGYSPRTAHSKSSLMARRPKVQSLVEHYRVSLGILDGGLLHRCLDTLLAIMEDESSSERARFRAATELMARYRAYRQNPLSIDVARRLYMESERSVYPTNVTPFPTRP